LGLLLRHQLYQTGRIKIPPAYFIAVRRASDAYNAGWFRCAHSACQVVWEKDEGVGQPSKKKAPSVYLWMVLGMERVKTRRFHIEMKTHSGLGDFRS
jgi:hypothetical protein